MSYFEFNNLVKICSGKNALYNIKSELDYFNAKTPLILSDEGLKQVGTLKSVLKIMQKYGVKTDFVFTNIPRDSGTDTINEISQYYKENKCDSIVALGGGSVIDTAKGVKLVISQNETNIVNLSGNENLNLGINVPFIVIPTTCGTGSECTSIAVIKDSKTHIKLEFISTTLLPNVAILDPEVISTLPNRLVATTALDALTHAIEAYSCLQKNPVSDSFAVSAMKLIFENLLLALNTPNKIEYKQNLLNASTLAGIAFSNSMVGIVHAIGHSLGAFNVPHGNAMSILMPACLKFNLSECEQSYKELLLVLKGVDFYVSTADSIKAETFINEISVYIENVARIANFSIKLKDYGVKQSDFEKIAIQALNDGASIVNPKIIKKLDVIKILEEVF